MRNTESAVLRATGRALPSAAARAALLVLLPVLLSACASLQPTAVPDEAPAAVAASPILEAAHPGFDGDWYVLLNRGVNALDWRLNAIDSAAVTIDIQSFLLDLDAVGAAVLEHLIAAADRGVRVRILLDDSFLFGKDEFVMLVHEHENMDFRIFNPYQRRADDAVTRQLLNLAEFHRLDHRMHNKSMVVDGRVAIIGGRNLADEYFGLHPQANFRDLELIAGGQPAQAASRAFADYWNDNWAFPADKISHVTPQAVDGAVLRERARPAALLHRERDPLQLRQAWEELMHAALPGRSQLLADLPPEARPGDADEAPVQVANALVELVESAQSEVIIVSAYLIPTPVVEDIIQRAEERGVAVKLLTNSMRSNNHLSAHGAYHNHIRTLLGHGAELYEVRIDAEDRAAYINAPITDKRLALHAKAMIVDHDRVFIGSANMDPRSLRINTEMGLIVESEPLNAALREAVNVDFADGNAWELRYREDGTLTWVSGDAVFTVPPADSAMQLIEDWFFAHLPIEDEL